MKARDMLDDNGHVMARICHDGETWVWKQVRCLDGGKRFELVEDGSSVQLNDIACLFPTPELAAEISRGLIEAIGVTAREGSGTLFASMAITRAKDLFNSVGGGAVSA